MPTVRHPRDRDDVAGHPPSAVTIDRTNYDVADDGTVEVPSDYEADRLASAYGLDVAAIELNQQSEDALVNDDGCPYCDEYDGDHVAQHIAQAHPDAGGDD
mgnify:CR=1 FL=1